MAFDHDFDRLLHRGGEAHPAPALAESAPSLGDADRRLRQGEERFAALVAATGQLVWATPPDGLVEDMPLWRAYTGQTPNEVRGRGWLDAVHPDDRPRVEAAWERGVAGRAHYEIEYRLRRHDGVYRSFLVRAVPVLDELGAVREWIGVHTDVTERKRLEDRERRTAREAAEHGHQLQAIFEALVDGVALYDAGGRILAANPAARELFALDGRPRDYLDVPLAERVARLDPSDERGDPLPADQWPMQRVLRGETLKGPSSTEVVVRRPDGRLLALVISGAPIRDEQEHVAGAVGIARDVTEQRRRDRRTQVTLNALLAMAETLVGIPDESALVAEHGSAATDVARRLAELMCGVLGCERAGIVTFDPTTGRRLPRAVYGLSPEDERRWWAAQEAAPPLPERPLPDDLWRRLTAGEVVIADMSRPPFDALPNPFGSRVVLSSPLLIGGQVIGVISLDYGDAGHNFARDELALAQAVGRLTGLILERERLLREREEAHSDALALQRANRRMDEFLGIASHELRTPLTSVKANLQIAMRRLKVATDETPEAAARLSSLAGLLARAERQTELLNRLVGDLLDVSRIQAGRLELRPKEIDLAALIRDAVQEQRQAWPTRSIRLSLPRGPARTVADPDRTGQVVTNYLANALKYSADDASIEVSLTREGACWRIAVRDRGPGIPPAELAHIWERFHRVQGIEVQSGSGVGLGLGLHISKNIVERQGGGVGVASAVGGGSEFWFTLLASDYAGATPDRPES